MDRRKAALVGAFVIGGVLLFSIGLFMIGDRRLLFTRHYEVATTFSKVSGLQVGTRVRLAGLEAGEVLEIRIPAAPSQPFLVRMRLREDLRQLVRTDSTCGVQTDGLVGGAFIQVSPGTDAAPIAGEGTILRGIDPIEFADLLEHGRETFELVNREIVSVREDVHETLSSLTRTIDTTGNVIARAGDRIDEFGERGVLVMDDVRRTAANVQGIVARANAGEGTIGRLLTDDALYNRLNAVTQDAAGTARALRDTTEAARDAVRDFTGPDGAGSRVTQSIRNTLAAIEEVTNDLSEGTEALKRNFLFRGFFRGRGFYDLDSVSREAYQAGLLERNRTAVRIWLEGPRLFDLDPDGHLRLTVEGRRRIEVAMGELVQYPRDTPLIVEGYAEATDRDTAYLRAAEQAAIVRDHLLSRFRRITTLTEIMPMGRDAQGSPRGDGTWEGVALTMFVSNDVFRGKR